VVLEPHLQDVWLSFGLCLLPAHVEDAACRSWLSVLLPDRSVNPAGREDHGAVVDRQRGEESNAKSSCWEEGGSRGGAEIIVDGGKENSTAGNGST
jgi:hypothetical protein